MKERQWLRPIIVLIALAAVAVSSCSSSSGPANSKSSTTAAELPRLTAETEQQRGTIVSSTPFGNATQALTEVGAQGLRMVYRSASGIDGGERDVSGSVFVPAGTPPPGGWPIIGYGHGTTGITNECGPSQYPDLLGYDLVVASLVKLGYVVALTDYEGLGHPGKHPYLEPTTAAFNIIDAVRATRSLVPAAGNKWVAVGVSQGGQAAWAANELADEYGEGLEFLGSASLSPAVDVAGLASLAESGWLTRAQQFWLPMLVEGLKVTSPDLDSDDYLRGKAAEDLDVWLACTGPLAEQRSTLDTLDRKDTEPATPEAAETLRAKLDALALPQRPSGGPMLVITGSADDLVREQWVTKAVNEACDLGDTVEFVVREGEGHNDLNGGPRVAEWLAERFSAKPPVDTC